MLGHTNTVPTRPVIARATKVVAALLITGLFLAVSISRLPFTTVSPDTIRFMHFAQINADRAVVEGGSAKNVITAVLRAIKGMNDVDYNRGRLAQGLVSGIDGVTRWMLPAASLNLLMILVLAINAGLVSQLATREIAIPGHRLNVALLSWIVLLTSSLVVSPVMLLTLYGKYIWITFLLAHFIARRPGWKIVWLIPTAFADEIGLLAVALVVFFRVGRHLQDPASPERAMLRGPAAMYAAIAAVNVILLYFGISAIVFNAGAEAFKSMSAAQLRRGVVTPGSIWEMALGVFWRAEEILLGFSTRITPLTTLIGVALMALVGISIFRHYSAGREEVAARRKETVAGFGPTLFGESVLSFYSYWVILFIVISWLVLPGPAYDLSQYSYPAAIVLSILLLRSLIDLAGSRRAVFVLGALCILHLTLTRRIVDESSRAVRSSLLPDQTVSVADIQRLNRSIEELRATGRSALFDSINNGKEIDFSATWYYSRVGWFGRATEPHWPVQGTVRVLTWPRRVGFKCVPRDFLYTRGAFVDRPCVKH